MVGLGQKLKLEKKNAEIDSKIAWEQLCAKNRFVKHPISQKWDDFENRPTCKG